MSVVSRVARAFAAAAMLAAMMGQPAEAAAQSPAERPASPPGQRERILRAIVRADSLARTGRVAAAESLYYAIALRFPREPAPRLALGRYLASRGALRIGAVLIEEARRFGASPAMAAVHLAPVYAAMGAWSELRDLPASPLGPAERQRAAWLAAHPPAVGGPDSVTVALLASRDPRAIGAVVLHLGADSIVAAIDPAVQGLVLDQSRLAHARVRRFAEAIPGARPPVGVADTVRIGGLVLTEIPVAFAPLGGASGARLGMDLLARFAPTVDRARARLTLRREGRVRPPAGGQRHPLLLEPGTGALVARDGALVPLVSGVARQQGWTIDPRSGELIVHR